MKSNTRSIKSVAKTKKGKRRYANPDATLFTHPTRAKIIDHLMEGKRTTGDLEALIGENRINLYHHLNLLESEAVISSTIENRQKVFMLSKNDIPYPQIIVIQIPKIKEIQEETLHALSKILDLVNGKQKLPGSDMSKSLSGKKIIVEFQ